LRPVVTSEPLDQDRQQCFDAVAKLDHPSPGKLTAAEVATVKVMVLAPEYRHMPLGTLVVT
jgi:hypothetical protein